MTHPLERSEAIPWRQGIHLLCRAPCRPDRFRGKRRDQQELDTTVEEILGAGGWAIACEVDVTDEKLVEQMVAETTYGFEYGDRGTAGE